MSKRRRILWSALTILFLLSLSLIFVAPRMRSAARLEPPNPKERIEMLQITVRPTGFEPAEIQHSNKKFLLAIDNQSGAENLTLELLEEDGQGKPRRKLREIGLSLQSLNKREVTHLPPGRYVLREVNHPEWACRITIAHD